MDVDGDELFGDALNIESNFYTTGYADGFAHGQQHGTFEGRALGREKAWEVWDELGFYEGFAGVWQRRLQSSGEGSSSRKEAKSLAHANTLLGLIASFPTTNPTPADSEIVDETGGAQGGVEGEGDAAPAAGAGAEVDLAALLSTIRARYRLLCTSVGARPRLVAVRDGSSGAAPGAGVVEGIEGPMKGVDTRQLKF